MKFDIRNLAVVGVVFLSSCASSEKGLALREGNLEDSATANSIPPDPHFEEAPQPLPTPSVTSTKVMSSDLRGVLLFQHNQTLSALSSGQTTSVSLRAKFSADGWDFSRDGAHLCFAEEPGDVNFFDVPAHRDYVFTADFNSAPRVLLAAYGRRAKEDTYNYGSPSFIAGGRQIVVDEWKPQQFMDDGVYGWIAIYDVQTRRRIWKSDDFVASLPTKALDTKQVQAAMLTCPSVSPDGNDLVCLTCAPSCSDEEADKAPATLLVHFDLKNHRAEVLDSFVNECVVGYLPFGGRIVWNGTQAGFVPQFAWHPFKKQFLWVKPVTSAKSLLPKSRSADEEVFGFDLATKKGWRVTQHPGNDFSPQWSLDGKTILWLRDGHIMRANSNGANPTPIFSQLEGVTQIQLLPKIADWSRYRKLSIEPLAGKDK